MSESLDTRQRQFLDHVRGMSDDAPDLADGPVPAALGLAVYVNAYRARLREALAADHPRLARHLGEARWLALCDAYIDAQPSTARSLRTFGDRLPEFISQAVPVGAASAAMAREQGPKAERSRLKSLPRMAAAGAEVTPEGMVSTAMVCGAAKGFPVGAASAAIEPQHFDEPKRSRLKSLPPTATVRSAVDSVGAASAAIPQPRDPDSERSRQAFTREAGQSLPQRTAASRSQADTDVALISELARFERSLLDAFDAADAPRTVWRAIEALPAEDWPGLRLTMHPSLRHLPLRTRAVAVWQSLGDGEDGGDVMGVVPPAVFVWRDVERITRFRAFAEDEEAALVGMLGGRDFARVCEDQLAFHDAASIPPRMIAWLRAWVDDGLVVGVVAAEVVEAA
ncbi:MAG: putative DNA-binding domain-containing protein [Xanthomonadales bacterium]|nr:putative DNA-binding domain-containing protein [Xanthomonadales bacterium]